MMGTIDVQLSETVTEISESDARAVNGMQSIGLRLYRGNQVGLLLQVYLAVKGKVGLFANPLS